MTTTIATGKPKVIKPKLATRARAGGALAYVPVLLTSTLWLGGCSTLDSWFGSDEPVVKPVELEPFEPTLEVDLRWRRTVGAGVGKKFLRLLPAVDGTRVYAAERKGRVFAFDPDSGESVWSIDTDAPVAGGPGVGEGLVLLGTSEGRVIALSADSGEERWRARLSSEVLAPPQVAQGVVVARTTDGKLFGLRADKGTRLWVYDRTVPVLTLRGTSIPALADGRVVSGLDSGRLVSLALDSGQTLWERRVATPRGRSELERMVDIDGDPVIVRNTVYVASFQGRVAAIDFGSGASVWTRELSSHAGLGVDRSNVYVTDELSHVWALDRRDGSSRWRQIKLQGRGVTAPTAFRGYVVVGDGEGYLHWLRGNDGQFVARQRIDSSGITEAPVVDRDTLYVYGKSGGLFALRIEP